MTSFLHLLQLKKITFQKTFWVEHAVRDEYLKWIQLCQKFIFCYKKDDYLQWHTVSTSTTDNYEHEFTYEVKIVYIHFIRN